MGWLMDIYLLNSETIYFRNYSCLSAGLVNKYIAIRNSKAGFSHPWMANLLIAQLSII